MRDSNDARISSDLSDVTCATSQMDAMAAMGSDRKYVNKLPPAEGSGAVRDVGGVKPLAAGGRPGAARRVTIGFAYADFISCAASTRSEGGGPNGMPQGSQ